MKATFESILLSFQYRYDIREVFNDFLAMVLCAFCPNPLTGKSHYEDEYLNRVERYKQSNTAQLFGDALAHLILEMEQRIESHSGNDVLGEFYEKHLYRKGAAQFFTPSHITEFMAQLTCGGPTVTTQRILDPCCGSGRMLLSSAKVLGKHHRYYGIDLDRTCVHMTAINLFLNGIFNAEVMCADALNPHTFEISYKLSFLPFGIFRIYEKEKSELWHMNQFRIRQNESKQDEKVTIPASVGTQLQIF